MLFFSPPRENLSPRSRGRPYPMTGANTMEERSGIQQILQISLPTPRKPSSRAACLQTVIRVAFRKFDAYRELSYSLPKRTWARGVAGEQKKILRALTSGASPAPLGGGVDSDHLLPAFVYTGHPLTSSVTRATSWTTARECFCDWCNRIRAAIAQTQEKVLMY